MGFGRAKGGKKGGKGVRKEKGSGKKGYGTGVSSKKGGSKGGKKGASAMKKGKGKGGKGKGKGKGKEPKTEDLDKELAEYMGEDVMGKRLDGELDAYMKAE
ncbi:unnamed protein product [Amoebophrya sp. A25]|nr:unnamed protein product [Amoebophrya sp. A25]|eukprot:GSA25T00011666001.1